MRGIDVDFATSSGPSRNSKRSPPEDRFGSKCEELEASISGPLLAPIADISADIDLRRFVPRPGSHRGHGAITPTNGSGFNHATSLSEGMLHRMQHPLQSLKC